MSHKNPKVAVLMASYNGMNYIAEQISSIQNQSNIDIDIIISVDKSSDNTYEYCKNLNYKNIKVLSYGKSLGCAKNFYRLIKETNIEKYDYISFADQDDIWHSEKILNAVESLITNKANGYSSNLTAFWPDGSQKMIIKSNNKKKYDFLFESASAGCTYVIDKNLALIVQKWLQGNLFDVNEFDAHDWLIYAIARFNDMNWFFDQRSFISYRQHNSNVAGANVGIISKLKRIKPLVGKGWFKKSSSKLIEIYKSINDGPNNAKYSNFLLNPLNLRRIWYESLFIYILKILKIL